jgi:hypothetical protein
MVYLHGGVNAMSKSVKRIILIGILFFILILLVGIGIYFYKSVAGLTDENEKEVLADIQTATNLEEMVSGADVIVFGTYEGLDATWNMARDQKDIQKEAKDLYIAGRLFAFHVEEVWKGSLADKEIQINHLYGLPFVVEKTFGYDDEEVEAVDPTYVSPSFHKSYIAFLKKSELGDFYMRAQEPFLISVDKYDVVKLESEVLEELDFEPSITGESLAEVKKEIAAYN